MTHPVRSFVLAAILPALTAALWAYSGRENLTKREKNVEVEAVDETFGDKITRVEARPGPVIGYYIGLDAVGGAAAAGMLIGIVGWWMGRRRGRKTTTAEE